jgi:transcriptional regulator with XRE-family HTH domain
MALLFIIKQCTLYVNEKQKDKKMMDLITKLEKEMKQRNFSAEDAAKIIGCSYSQVYRWISGESKPSYLSRNAIDRAIKKMRRMAPVVTIEKAEKDRSLYRKLTKKITLKEKLDLLENTDDYSAYQKELLRLAKKYNIKD